MSKRGGGESQQCGVVRAIEGLHLSSLRLEGGLQLFVKLRVAVARNDA